jgi:hypothetical protein
MRQTLFALALTGLGSACAGAAENPREEEPPHARPAALNMRLHFIDVATARDAIIRGDLDQAHEALGRISDVDYGDDLPPDWVEWIRQMQDVARRSSETHHGIEGTARAVAELTASCADCHRTTLGGPPVADSEDPYPFARSLEERMRQHAWGTEQLWLGLTAPSHEAWVRGARAVAARTMDPNDTPFIPPADADDPPFVSALREVISSGEELERARHPSEMTERYAELLSRCASCHTHYGVELH